MPAQNRTRSSGKTGPQVANNAAADDTSIRDRAEQIAGKAGDKLKAAGEEVAETSRQAAEGVAAQIASETAEAVHDIADPRKKRAGEYLSSVGAAIDAGRDKLEEDGLHVTASVADTTSRHIHSLAEDVDDLDFGGATRKVEDFMRSRPLVSFGVAALLGFAAYQMLKSSDARRTNARIAN